MWLQVAGRSREEKKWNAYNVPLLPGQANSYYYRDTTKKLVWALNAKTPRKGPMGP